VTHVPPTILCQQETEFCGKLRLTYFTLFLAVASDLIALAEIVPHHSARIRVRRHPQSTIIIPVSRPHKQHDRLRAFATGLTHALIACFWNIILPSLGSMKDRSYSLTPDPGGEFLRPHHTNS